MEKSSKCIKMFQTTNQVHAPHLFSATGFARLDEVTGDRKTTRQSPRKTRGKLRENPLENDVLTYLTNTNGGSMGFKTDL